MSKRRLPNNNMVAKSKNKVLACSTPEHRLDSPSRDSDSMCDSDAGSPVPFLCTQDGAEGETDVVWNFYTPRAEKATSRTKNTTPLSRRTRKSRSKLIERPVSKRRPIKQSQIKTELFKDLIELNQNLNELIGQNSKDKTKNNKQACSEDDIFSDSSESSPKSGLRSQNSHCLRRNVLSSKFKKSEPETVIDSDDSMNECLLRASQAVEENIINYEHSAPKRPCLHEPKVFREHDSMDIIFNNIKLDSPLNKVKNCVSPRFNNDSFDNLLEGLNDSTLEKLTQVPVKDKKVTSTKDSSWVLEDITLHGESPSSKSVFGRHSSMPVSPSITIKDLSKPSTSGMALGRYSSMPFNKNESELGDSPLRCTPDEIKKKHQQAREKLMAKRLLPFTATQQTQSSNKKSEIVEVKPQKKTVFQPRIPSASTKVPENNKISTNIVNSNSNKIVSVLSKEPANNDSNLKLIIERKRQEALMKLRKRQAK